MDGEAAGAATTDEGPAWEEGEEPRRLISARTPLILHGIPQGHAGNVQRACMNV